MKTRWIVLTTPWYECIAAAMPFLSEGTWIYMDPEKYIGPDEGERDVVMAPHRAPQLAPLFQSFGNRVVLYETENMLDPACPWVAPSTRLRLACPANPWLNYSAANASMFGDGVHSLRKIHNLPARAAGVDRPIDVLFVGSLNARRVQVLGRLQQAGVKVHVPPGPVFGSALAILEARAKLLLNMHYYTPGVFESFRVVPAAHRGTPVISEKSERNEGNDWAPCYPYADLVEATLSVLKGMRRGQ